VASIFIAGVQVLDRGGSFTGPVDVSVLDGRIAAVGSGLRPGKTQPRLDGGGLWLMPGVFDCHLHAGLASFDQLELMRTPISRRVLETAHTLRRTLAAGVTFVRDAGALDAGVKEAVTADLVPGPELQVSVVALGTTGGHGDGFLAGPGLECPVDYMLPDYPGRPPYLADGPDGFRAAVRRLVRSGADWIKLLATGGVLSAADGEFAAELGADEISAAVAEAGRRGRPVMVHALGGPALRQAVEAGARSIEHGVFLTEQDAAAMAARGCALVPTLVIYDQLAAMASAGQLTGPRADRARAVGQRLGEAVAIARDAGVPIALGSDFGHRDDHGRNLAEITLLHRAGLSIEAALLAATASGAELCGVGDRLGRIEAGYQFDAILLDRDPADPAIFTRPGCVTGVFQRGVPVVPHPRLAGQVGGALMSPCSMGLTGIGLSRTCPARGVSTMAHPPGAEEIRRPGLTRRKLLRHGAAGVGLLAAGPVLAACGSSGTSSATASTSSGAPKRGGTLSFGRQTGPTQLDPANSIVEGDVYTLDKIFEPLYITSPAGQLVPWLAQGHTVSSDGKTWTFALRPGVKFSDGKPVTADDVVFSILRAGGDKNGPLSFLDFAIKSLKADGSSTVVATLSQPWAPFLSDISVFANAIVPKDFGGQSESAFFTQPVGTGPFTLKSLTKGGNVSLVRNPHYWQAGKPYLDGVDFVYINDDNQRVLQLKSGQVQVIAAVPPTQVSALKADSSVVLEAFPAWAADLLFFNEKVPQFADRHVRRAISYALDIGAIAKATTYGTAQPGGSFFPPSLQYYKNVPTLSYDLSSAKAELAQSKYPHGFSFQLLVSSGNSQYVAAATIIQQQLKPLGITVTLNQLDDAAFHTAFEAFNYQAMINGAINDISDPDEMASFQVDVQNGGSHSFWTYYDNPSAIALVRQAETEFDDTKRADLYGQIQAIVAQDAPYIALDYPPNIYAWSPRLHGFAVNPGGAYRLEDVWLG
jgi:peptide/nickel transport system substrate-binding protein